MYLAFDVSPDRLPDAFAAMRSMDIGGYSVTMPHKAQVLDLVDEVSPAAQNLQAANCVVNRDGTLVAHNTDGDGFVNGLKHDTGFEVAGCTATVLGAGGAARAVIEALVRHGAAEVSVVNRSTENAAIAATAAGGVARVGDAADIARSQLVVNATPLGMAANPEALPCDPSLLRAEQVVADLIYAPSQTSWMRSAAEIGATATNGLSMLVFQAATQFTLWTGESAPIDRMFQAVDSALSGRSVGDS